MALNVGELFAALSFKVDDSGAKKFDRQYDDAQAKARKKVEAQLGAHVDPKGFAAYHEALDRVEQRAKRKEAYRVALGVDFDPRAFAASERALQRHEREAKRAQASTKSFSDEIHGLNVRLPQTAGLMAAVKPAALITGLGLAAQAASAATAGAVALGSALAPLGGAMAAYPALGSAAAQALGVFKLATSNVFEAVGGLNQKLDTNAKAFKELDPQAQKLARHLDQLKAPLRDLQRVAQRGLFPGLEEGIQAASRNLPVFSHIVADTSRAMGAFAQRAGEMIGSRAWGRDFETQGRRNVLWMERGGNIALRFADSLRNVTLAAGPLVNWMTLGAERLARLVDQQVASGRESGKLAHFFDETRIAISRVVRIGADLAVAFWNIGRAGKPLGDEILVNLVKAADQFRRWTDSARGQNAIKKWFEDARPAVFELGRLVRDAGIAFLRLGRGDQVAPLLHAVRVDLLPAFAKLTDQTTRSFGPPLIEAIKQVALLFTHMGGTSGPLTQTIILVGRIAGALNRLLDRFPALNSAMVTIAGIGGLAKVLGITSAIGGVSRLITQLRLARATALLLQGAEAGAGAAAGGAAASAAGGAAAGATARQAAQAARTIPTWAKVAGAIAGVGLALSRINRSDTIRSDRISSVGAAINAFNRQLDRLNRLGDTRGADRLADQFFKLTDAAGKFKGSARDVQRLTDAAKALADEGGTTERTLHRALDQSAAHFADFRKTGSDNIHGIRTATADNMHFIRRVLNDDSSAGKEALAKNFRLARTAIRQSMNDGKISVRQGLAEIQRLMRAELRTYGLSGGQITSYLRSSGHGSGNEAAGGGHQRGGFVRRLARGGMFLGGPGLVSDDIVPIGDNAVAALGEYLTEGAGGKRAVLNRHHQPVVRLALAAGGYPGLEQGVDLDTIEQAMAPLGGLHRLFQSITRPHMLARGGPVQRFAAGGLQSAVASLAHRLEQMFGLVITSTTGGQHAPGSYHYQGLAADLGGSSSAMTRAAEWIKSSGVYRSLLEGIHNPNLAVKNGRLFGGAGPFGGVWANHANHIHVALRALGAMAGASNIRAPQTTLPGALGGVVQGALNAAARGANARVEQIAGTLGGGDISDVGGASGPNVGLAQSMAAARGWTGAQWNALRSLWTQESGFRTTATNRSSGAYGIPQALPGSKMASAGSDWRTNPATQIRWGLDYIAGRYGSPAGAWAHEQRFNWYRRGGVLRRFAPGGPVNYAPHDLNDPRLSGKRLSIRALNHTQTDRVGEYNRIIAKIADDQKVYGQRERLYNMTDEKLLDDQGNVDEAAVKHRAGELLNLRKISQRIYDAEKRARLIAQRVVKSYQTIIGRLSGSLKHAKKKDRAGIQSQIKGYQGKLGEWRSTLHDLGFDVEDRRLDLLEVSNEYATVTGTQPNVTADAGVADTTGAADADLQARVDQLTALAQEATANLARSQQTIAAFGSSGTLTPVVTRTRTRRRWARRRSRRPSDGRRSAGAGPGRRNDRLPEHQLSVHTPPSTRRKPSGSAYAVSGMALQPTIQTTRASAGI
jgi:hypothetical protein